MLTDFGVELLFLAPPNARNQNPHSGQKDTPSTMYGVESPS